MSKKDEHIIYSLNNEKQNAEDISTGRIKKLKALNCQEKMKLIEFYGLFRYLYLLFLYGSDDSYIDYVEDENSEIKFCGLLIPNYKMIKRYPFVKDAEYSVIACKTKKKYRGKGIYSNELKGIRKSGISKNGYIIWTSGDNIYSNKGILRAGGRKIQELIIEKKLLGLIVQCGKSAIGDTTDEKSAKFPK